MIMKIIISEVDKQYDLFEIDDYYTECENYLEATIKGDRPSDNLTGGRRIVINARECELTEIGDAWEELVIYTDSMVEILRIVIPEEPIEVEAN